MFIKSTLKPSDSSKISLTTLFAKETPVKGSGNGPISIILFIYSLLFKSLVPEKL